MVLIPWVSMFEPPGNLLWHLAPYAERIRRPRVGRGAKLAQSTESEIARES